MILDTCNNNANIQIQNEYALKSCSVGISYQFGKVSEAFKNAKKGNAVMFQQFYNTKIDGAVFSITDNSLSFNSSIERGLREVEKKLKKAFSKVGEMDATEFIKDVFYANSRDEGEMECSVALKMAVDSLGEPTFTKGKKKPTILIVNPSPFLLEEWFLNYYQNYIAIFMILNEDGKGCLKDLYSKQFEGINSWGENGQYAYFFSVDELMSCKKKIDGFNFKKYDAGLFFIRKMGLSNEKSRYTAKDVNSMISNFLKHSPQKSFIFGDLKKIRGREFEEILHENLMAVLKWHDKNGLSDKAIFALEEGANEGEAEYYEMIKEEKRCLIEYKGQFDKQYVQRAKDRVRAILLSAQDYYFQRKEAQKVEPAIVEGASESLQEEELISPTNGEESMISPTKEGKSKKVKRRNTSLKVPFAKEILFQYSTESKGKSINFVFTYKSHGNGMDNRMKKVKKEIKELMKLGYDSLEQNIQRFIENFVFQKTYYESLRVELQKSCERGKINRKELSLKTMWIFMEDKLNPKTYRKDYAIRLFTYAEEISKELADWTFPEGSEEDFQKLLGEVIEARGREYIPTIKTILESAVAVGYLPKNPISSSFFERYSQRQTKREKQLSNALRIKELTIEEIGNIIVSAIEQTVTDGKKRPRFEIEQAALITLLRLYTGISVKECCSLTWRDFGKFEGYNFHYLVIREKIKGKKKRGGKGESIEQEEWQNGGRAIPIVYPLDAILIKKLNELRESVGNEEELSDYPIFSEKSNPLKPLNEIEMAKKCRAYLKKNLPESDLGDMLLPIATSEEQEEQNKTPDYFDLRAYHGDILQSNFKYYASLLFHFDSGETAYYLGIKPFDTFEIHYCDYANENLLYRMYTKLLAGSLKWLECVKRMNWFKKSSVNDVEGTKERDCTMSKVEIELKVEEGKDYVIEIETKYGYLLEVIFYEE